MTYISENVGHSDLPLTNLVDLSISYILYPIRLMPVCLFWRRCPKCSLDHFDLYLRETRSQWPNFNKLELGSYDDSKYQIRMISACWFLRRRFLKVGLKNVNFGPYFPETRSQWPNLNKLGTGHPRGPTYQIWTNSVERFERKRRKCKKCDWRTDGQTH